jgi:hypothetical protein
VIKSDAYIAFDFINYILFGIKSRKELNRFGFKELIQSGSVWLIYNEFGFIRNDNMLHIKEVITSVN